MSWSSGLVRALLSISSLKLQMEGSWQRNFKLPEGQEQREKGEKGEKVKVKGAGSPMRRRRQGRKSPSNNSSTQEAAAIAGPGAACGTGPAGRGHTGSLSSSEAQPGQGHGQMVWGWRSQVWEHTVRQILGSEDLEAPLPEAKGNSKSLSPFLTFWGQGTRRHPPSMAKLGGTSKNMRAQGSQMHQEAFYPVLSH